MIIEKIGNILDSKCDIIAHQTNCKGVMGSGLAKQIKEKYPDVYEEFLDLYYDHGSEMFGEILFVKTEDGKIIANLYGQLDYGRDRQYTDYEKLESCIMKLHKRAVERNKSVAIPYKLGCGTGGGDWEVVYKIIEKYFGNDNTVCEIVKLK